MSDPLMDLMLSGFDNPPTPPMGYTENNSATHLSSEIQALRQRLLYATLEKETLRTNAMNEIRLKEDCVNQLYQLLKQTTFERDEARQHLLQLQHLLLPKPQTTQTQTSPPSDPLVDLLPLPPSLQFPITSTDSNNHSSYISSPVDSIFDVVVSSAPSDHLHRLMNSRPLPEMGKLMQTVADAGPVLKTLLVSGPLPRWRNPPPPPVQTVQMPPAVGLSGRKRPLMPAPEMSGLGPDAKRLLKEVLRGC
ncbi:hypothetical protein QJS04_geneDACA011198 [Acorus gramineus]|uniref:Uncharacterized protein n=1 Tax=Acorus gramineus TaxID=55184 RepID=A0AAV9AMU5_ACOGR|nr:hypothetical protein QJS04_geneDACA011198 [Acorus gramineus]